MIEPIDFTKRYGDLLAVDAINSPKDFMQGKKWIAERKHPDPVQLADLSVDLKTL